MAANKRNMSSEEMKAQVLDKIQKYKANDFPEAERLHDLIMEADPSLHTRLWYGMPGYSKTKDSAVILYFRKDRYITFGLSETIKLATDDDANDNLTPCAWFISELDTPTEQRVAQIVRSIAVD